MLPVQHIPAADWPVVSERFAAARIQAGFTLAQVAEAIDATEDEVRAFEGGHPSLGIYDLRVLADLWRTTTGAWFCGDKKPLLRSSDGGLAEEAAQIGAGLMARYLAEEALAE